MTEPQITDQDVRDIAEWLHPLWFDSEHGRSQTYGQLEQAVRGALESRGPAMHDRWVRAAVAAELDRIANEAFADDPGALGMLLWTAQEWREGNQ